METKIILLLLGFQLIHFPVWTQNEKKFNVRFEKNDFKYFKDNNGLTHIRPNKQLNYSLSSDTAQPALPYTSVSILIPKDADVASYTFSTKSEKLFSEISIAPCSQVLQTDSFPSVKKEIYKGYQEKLYPLISVTKNPISILQGYKYVSFIICPFLYKAASNELDIITKLELTVKLITTEKSKSISIKKEGKQIVRSLIINPEDLDVLYPDANQVMLISSSDDVEYLVVTLDSLKRYFQPLIAWKNQKGIASKIVSIEEIESTYTGSTTQLKIKNCLSDYYQNKNLKWVLLGGDNTIVPVQFCYGAYDGTLIPTDLYYACFDNCFDWNANCNSLYGEIADSIDIVPEINISRVPIRNSKHIETFIKKTLEYEKSSPLTDYVERMLLSGDLLGWYFFDKSDSHVLSERMYRDYIEPYWSGSKNKFYDTGTDFQGNELYHVDTINFHEQLSNGYHFIHMTAHGDRNCFRMEKIGNISTYYTFNNATKLQNSKKFILVTNGCETNAFDYTTPDPCLSESFIRNPNGGCIAYWGGSRSGFYIPGDSTISLSLAFSAAFFYELFNGTENPSKYSFGALTTRAKISRVPFSMPNSYDQIFNRWIQFSQNAIGDPEMPIYTYNPTIFYNATVSQNGTEVTVSTGGVDSCRITLTSLNPNISFLSYVDNASSYTFSDITVPYSVTITKHNYEPFVYLTDVYIQDTLIENDLYIQGRNIFVGDPSLGNVKICNGAHVVFDAEENCNLENGFECELGSSFEIK